MKKEYLLFDLDGTLTDSRPGIFQSIRHALEYYDMTAEDAQLQPFLGPPLVDSFMKYFGFSKERVEECVVHYREYYRPKGMFENEVYPGVPEGLKCLQDAGCKLMLATSKPELFARQILDHFDLTKYFTIIAGASMDEKRNTKADVLRYLLAQIPDVEQARERGAVWMIGDRCYDVLGAAELGLPCLGVRYGYAAPGELEEAGAKAIVESVEEMVEFCLH